MLSSTFIQVTKYITENILHSSNWDEADDITKTKAVNNSINLITKLVPARYGLTSEDKLPYDILANQVVWMLRIDDSFLRAEMGVTYIQMSGIMITLVNKDLSICPYILNVLGISPDPITGGITQRKVGTYSGRKTGTEYSRLRREQ